jgi:hypothetical protein
MKTARSRRYSKEFTLFAVQSGNSPYRADAVSNPTDGWLRDNIVRDAILLHCAMTTEKLGPMCRLGACALVFSFVAFVLLSRAATSLQGVPRSHRITVIPGILDCSFKVSAYTPQVTGFKPSIIFEFVRTIRVAEIENCL